MQVADTYPELVTGTTAMMVEHLGRVRTLMPNGSIRGALKSGWGFADQSVISASNFIMMILLARQLGPQAFGMFVLAYTALMFTNSLQGALFTQPHNVLGSSLIGEEYAQYTSATFLSQVSFSLLAGFIVAVAGFTLTMLGHFVGPLLTAVACAIITWQLQEYCRRVFYTQGDYILAFSNDLVTYGGQVVGMIMLWRLGLLTASSAIYAVAIASLIGTILGVWRLRRELRQVPARDEVLRIIRGNWAFGKWLAGSQVMSWVSGQLYPVLTAGFVGAAATGGLRATQNFVAPTHILSRTYESLAVPRCAKAIRSGGHSALRRQLSQMGIPIGLMLGGYLALAVLLRQRLVDVFLGDSYQQYSWLVVVYAVSFSFAHLNKTATIALRSMGASASIFRAFSISAVLVLTLGVFLVFSYGLIGAAIGTIFHQVSLSIFLWLYVSKTISSLRVSDD